MNVKAAPVSEDEFKSYAKGVIAGVNRVLDKYMSEAGVPQKLDLLIGKSSYDLDQNGLTRGSVEPGKYLFGMNANRHRPVLMLTLLDALGGDSNANIDYAIIPEMIHNATLVHDDIEDDSDMRRGEPSVHKKFGLPLANNLGDYLYYFPLESVLKAKGPPAEMELLITRLYRRTMLRATVGQTMDLAWSEKGVDRTKITESNYLRMVELKSGALLAFACELAGALAYSNQETIDNLGDVGMALGVGFQIVDDIENIAEGAGIAEKKGGAGEDITDGKVTLMVIHALSHASRDDRERLLAILNMHTKNAMEIREAISLINKYGSIDYARGLSRSVIGSAWEQLDRILPNSIAKERVRAMVAYLLGRTN